MTWGGMLNSPAPGWRTMFQEARGYFWTTWPQAQPVYHADRHINWGHVYTNMDKSESTSFFKNFTFHILLASIFQHWKLSTYRYIYISFDMALEVNDVPPKITHIKPAAWSEWCVWLSDWLLLMVCLFECCIFLLFGNTSHMSRY